MVRVSDCICAKEQELLGNTCHKPRETCIGFGDFAQFYIDNSTGRKIDTEEAFKLLDQAEDVGLVLQPTNTQEIAAVCCCCTCCCPSLRFAKMSDSPSDFILSYYKSTIDPDLCVACGDCIERCPMDAIQEGESVSEIIDRRCIGCGLCVSSCPEEAISLVEKQNMEEPQKDFRDNLNQIEQRELL